MTLTDFLLERIAQDEVIARMATYDDYPAIDVTDENGPTEVHIARHDPARVLTDCAAKRRLIDYAYAGLPRGYGMDVLSASLQNGGHMLRLLALPYADHPDYDEEWKP